MIRIFFCFLVISLCSVKLLAQEETPQTDTTHYNPNQNPGKLFNTWSISAHLGKTVFHGEISSNEWWPSEGNNRKTGFGLSLNKSITPTFTLMGNFFSTSLRGETQERYFESSVLEGSLLGGVNLSNLLNPNRMNRKLAIEGYVGFGFTNYDSKSYMIEGNEETNSLSGSTLALPIGFGAKLKLTKKIDLGLRYTITHASSDELDGYALSTSDSKDKYTYFSANVTYHFGKKEKTLYWVSPHEILLSDQDNDGVLDLLDKQKDTPLDAPVDGGGIAMDTDGDGVADVEDMQKLTPNGAKVNGVGVAIDKDKDGVPDSFDKEQDTPEGAFVNFQGVTIGKLPKQEPVSTEFPDSILSATLPSLYFGLGSSTVDALNLERLSIIVRLMEVRPEIKMEVIGFADKTGNSAVNRDLSRKRAEAVLDILVTKYNISKDRLFINFFGDTKLLSSTPNAAVNRRVDFQIAE